MNKNSKKCLVVFGPLRISEDTQSFKGKGPGDPFDLFLISKPVCKSYFVLSSLPLLHHLIVFLVASLVPVCDYKNDIM